MNTIGSVNLARILITAAHTDGGTTIDRMGNKVGDGFIVGGVCPSLVVDGDNPSPAQVDEVAAWVLGDGEFLGSWWDGATGKIHIDIVSFVTDRDDAIRLGIDRGEIAIWDSAAGEEIRMADYAIVEEGSGSTLVRLDAIDEVAPAPAGWDVVNTGDGYDDVSEVGYDPYAGCYMDDEGPDPFDGHYDESGY